MGIVNQAVADGIGVGGVGDVLVPPLLRDLAGDDRGASAITILEHLEKIAPLRVGDRCHRPVIEDQDVDLGELGEDAGVGAVGASECEFGEEPGGAAIDGAMPLRQACWASAQAT